MSFLGVNGNTTVHNDRGSSSKENETVITPRNEDEDGDYVESPEDNEKPKRKPKKASKNTSKKASKKKTDFSGAKNSDLFLDDQALEAKINSLPRNSNSFVVFLMSSS